MLFNQFINRQRELADLEAFFTCAPQVSKVIFVSGKSGVGKSQFTAEFVKRNNARPAIRVTCPVPAFDKTVKDGIFIRNLSLQVNEMAVTEGFESISIFANRLSTNALSEDYDRRLLDDARKFTFVAGFNALRTIWRRKRHTLFRLDELYRVSATWQPIIHHDYLLTALRGINAIVIIENFQLIDYESLLLIQNLVRALPATTWLLEYTEVEKTSAQMRTYEEFRRACGNRSKRLSLAPVPLDDILSTSRLSIPLDMTPLIEQQYRDHGGNLRILLDTSLVVGDGHDNAMFQSRLKQNPELDATIFRLDCLNHSGLFLLALVLANDAHIETDILDAMYSSKLQDLRLVPFCDALSFVQRGSLVIKSPREILIAHDKVSDAFATDPARSIVYSLALNVSVEFYEKCKSSEDYPLLPSREAALRLLKIRLLTNPLMIFAQFVELREAVLRSANRCEAEGFLRAVKDALLKEIGVTEGAWWDLAQLCYEANLHGLAAEISDGKPATGDWRLLRGFVFHNLDCNEQALSEIQPLFETKAPASAMLTALILKMVCLRSLGDFEGAGNIARVISSNKEFVSEPEYGHFLRNVEFLRGPEEGLFSVQQSVKWFSDRRCTEEERQAKVTLAMQLARLGQTKEALSELRSLLKRQEVRISDSHILWNDIAVVEMMEGRFKEKQRNLLERSRLTGALDFDRIVTVTNLALWHANDGQIDEALRLFSSIESLVESETDAHLRCAVFFNRGAVLSRSGHSAEAAMWKNRLRAELKDHDAGYQAYWQTRAGAGTCEEKQFKFLLTLPFHYLFLVHWSFPLRVHFEWK
jgi:tetratricopeptide (TPR) repeat protein